MRFLRLVIALNIFAALSSCAKLPADDRAADCHRRQDLECADLVLQRTEKQLTDAYQRVADTLEDESVKRFAKAHRDWLKFRDSYADFVAARESEASAVQLALVNQKIDADLARIDELKKQLKTANAASR